jgi:general secretion pathway protein G
MKLSRSSMHGFTLIELVVSLAILGLIATMVAPIGEVVIKREKEQDLKKSLRQIRDAIDTYKAAYDSGHMLKKVDQSGYPPNLEILEEGVDDAASPNNKRIYFIRKLPRDPFADPALKPADSWGLRCYASSAKAPAKGADVFDIFSMSEDKGLNGIPYAEW